LRLENAKDLLAHSRLTIIEIAMATGYSSQHLARQFRRHLGCTPGAYRRQHVARSPSIHLSAKVIQSPQDQAR
jgi:AraC family transcriptional regulator